MTDKKEASLAASNSMPELNPDETPNTAEEINPANDDRSLDIGESGQFAPGGRYNELNVTKPRRIDLDEQVNTALGDENS